MARQIILKEKYPLEIKPQKDSVWVCCCGLSKKFPFCDGSHKLCKNEEEGKIYSYAQEGQIKEIKD